MWGSVRGRGRGLQSPTSWRAGAGAGSLVGAAGDYWYTALTAIRHWMRLLRAV